MAGTDAIKFRVLTSSDAMHPNINLGNPNFKDFLLEL